MQIKNYCKVCYIDNNGNIITKELTQKQYEKFIYSNYNLCYVDFIR